MNRQLKINVFKALISKDNFLGKYDDYDRIMLFLEKIWPLREMKSEDARFSNAYDDIYQHVVNNNDWDDEYLFLKRLNLIEQSDDLFYLFLETVVHPETRNSKIEINDFVYLINNLIENEDIKLILSDYFEEFPVYKIRSKEGYDDLPSDISPNKVPIYKTTTNNMEFPCFLLEYNNWDDYSHKTSMSLYYLKSLRQRSNIGSIKLMKKDELITWDILEDKFYNLSNEYCSLGQTRDYYKTLKTEFPKTYHSVLLALRDAAMFPKISEEYEDDYIFRHSLIRYNAAEEVFRTIRYELNGDKIKDYFKFNYAFKPPFSEDTINLYFNFEYHVPLEHRIIAIIGKNGTGKTSILSSLINLFSKQEESNNVDKKPVFGKYFTVSYSVFDRFDVPKPHAAFNYVYCGLKNADGTLISDEVQLQNFYAAAAKIVERDFTYQWYKILKNFLSEEHLDLMFPNRQVDLQYTMVKFSSVNFTKIKNHFSSGESILIFIITKIVSEIRNDSLILYDEPETHLHPNAISSLMNSLFELVTSFKSFCIIATHSPLIVRELHTNDVFVLKRENSNLNISRLDKDPFAENLTIITEEIFGNRDVAKHYLDLMKSLVKNGNTYEEILSMIQQNDVPVSLSVRLYLKSLISQLQ